MHCHFITKPEIKHNYVIVLIIITLKVLPKGSAKYSAEFGFGSTLNNSVIVITLLFGAGSPKSKSSFQQQHHFIFHLIALKCTGVELFLLGQRFSASFVLKFALKRGEGEKRAGEQISKQSTENL